MKEKKTMYLPQFFKENNPYVELCAKYMNKETILQYQLEERSLISRRIKTARFRLASLLEVMEGDEISQKDKVLQLREELAAHYKSDLFLKCKNMGHIMKVSLEMLSAH